MSINLNKIAYLSIDFVDHYSLIFLIVKSGLFAQGADRELGLMHDYPKLAHSIVTFFIFTKLGIYSLKISTLLSIFILCTIILYIEIRNLWVSNY